MSAPLVKFKTGGGYGKGLIQPVECVRETDNSVWIAHQFGGGESRQAKVSGHTCFHDTWEAAHTHLMQKAEREVTGAQTMMRYAGDKLARIKAMTPPAA